VGRAGRVQQLRRLGHWGARAGPLPPRRRPTGPRWCPYLHLRGTAARGSALRALSRL